MLVNGPGKLIVQLPSNESEDEGCDGHQNRLGNQFGPDLGPNSLMFIFDKVTTIKGAIPQGFDSIVDLVKLNGCVDENADVVENEPDDLNGVLLLQGIVDEDELVDVAKHEDGEVSGDGADFIVVFGDVSAQAGLELGKDVSVGIVSLGSKEKGVEQ